MMHVKSLLGRTTSKSPPHPTCRDDACEISPWPHYIEISPTPNIFIGRLLDVFALASTNVRQGSIACAATACDTTGGAVLPRSNATTSSASCRAPTSSDKPTTGPCDDSTIAATCPGHTGSSHSASRRVIHGGQGWS